MIGCSMLIGRRSRCSSGLHSLLPRRDLPLFSAETGLEVVAPAALA